MLFSTRSEIILYSDTCLVRRRLVTILNIEGAK